MKSRSVCTRSQVFFSSPAQSTAMIFAIRFAGACPRLAMAAIFPQMMMVFAVGPTAVGTLMMTNSISAVIANLAYKKIVARCGMRVAILLSGILCAWGLASTVFSSEFFTIFSFFGVSGGLGWGLFALRIPQELVSTQMGASWQVHTRASLSAPLAAAVVVPSVVLFCSSRVEWSYILVAIAGIILFVAFLGAYSYAANEQAEVDQPPPALSSRSPVMKFVVVNTCVSGYMTGTLSTHLILVATQNGLRSFSEVAAWSAGFALISIVAVYVWPTLQSRRWGLVAVGVIASMLSLFARDATGSALGLTSLLIWGTYSSGAYIDALRGLSKLPKAMATTWNGRVLILHMVTGGLGGFFSGVLAEKAESYFPVFVTLMLLFCINCCLTIGTNRKRSTDQWRSDWSL